MTKMSAGLLAALTSMIAVPDFSSREWDVQIDGQPEHVRYCIRAMPSSQVQVGTVLRFVGECPYGWLHANGQYIVRELYPELYAVLESLAPPDSQSPQAQPQSSQSGEPRSGAPQQRGPVRLAPQR